MSASRALARLVLLVVGFSMVPHVDAADDPAAAGDTLVIRLVHPERQAAQVLKLFEGAKVAHPAAALAGWKRATHDTGRLGKPLEAALALLNPEMVPEWKVLHDADLRVDMGAADGKARWYAVVPHDDGTCSAVITAMRMTEGGTLSPLASRGTELTVEKLGPGADAFVAVRSLDRLIVGTSRDELERALRRLEMAPPTRPADDAEAKNSRTGPAPGSAASGDSGLLFEFDPGRWSAQAPPTANRRAALFLQGLGCQRIYGKLALAGDVLNVDMTTRLMKAQPSVSAPAPTAVVDPAWLNWVPARNTMGVVSLAIEPGPAFWNTAFAAADRFDRADPARAKLSPLRVRLNLMAAAANARPETDLWPHLRGVTISVAADPRQAGLPGDVLAILHMDADASAQRLAIDVMPRLGALLTGKKPGGPASPKGAPDPVAAAPAEATHELGTVGGRPLSVYWRGRDVVIAWGQDILAAAKVAAAKPEQSVAPICTGWAREGKQPPQRLGVIWPGRWQPPVGNVDAASPAWQSLAADPPALWWGWTGTDQAQDSIRYTGLRDRLHRFLDQLPLDPSPLR